MFDPLIASAARARRAIGAQGQGGAEDFVGGYRTAPRRTQRGFDDITKQAERSAKEQAKATEKSEREQARVREWSYQIKRRTMEKEERDTDRMLRKQEAARTRMISAAGRTLGGVAMGIGGAAYGLGRRAVGAGAGLIGDAASESLETQSVATRVAINARAAGKQGVDPTELRKQFEQTAIANPGQDAAEIGKATQAYVDLTGDIDTATGSMGTFATVASATGAKVEDVAKAAASLGSKFDVKTAKDMQSVLAGLAFQGKGGAMTLADLAAQFQRLAAAGAAFGLGKGPAAVAKLGGVLQIARQGTGNARQAATAVENIFASLTQKAGKSLYGKNGEKRDINEVLAEKIASAGGNDPAQKTAALMKFFGKQGYRGVTPMLAEYRRASEGKTGEDAKKAGYDAVLKMLNDMASTGGQWTELQKDAALEQGTASNQLKGAWEQLKSAAGDKLAPKLAEIATKLATDGKGLDLFVAAIGGAVDGLDALAALLQKFGVISGGTPEERKLAAEKKRDALGQQIDAMGPEGKLTPEDQAKRRALNTKKLKAEQEIADATRDNAVEVAKPADKSAQELFAKRYGELAGPGMDKDAQAAKGMALAANPKSWANSDFVQGLTGESDAQRTERNKFTERRGEYGPENLQGPKMTLTAAEALIKSAASLEKAAGALGKGGPAPGSTTGP